MSWAYADAEFFFPWLKTKLELPQRITDDHEVRRRGACDITLQWGLTLEYRTQCFGTTPEPLWGSQLVKCPSTFCLCLSADNHGAATRAQPPHCPRAVWQHKDHPGAAIVGLNCYPSQAGLHTRPSCLQYYCVYKAADAAPHAEIWMFHSQEKLETHKAVLVQHFDEEVGS